MGNIMESRAKWRRKTYKLFYKFTKKYYTNKIIPTLIIEEDNWKENTSQTEILKKFKAFIRFYIIKQFSKHWNKNTEW